MIPLSGWSHCKPITVQHAYVDEDLAYFSFVVFRDNDTDIGAHALANGHDIRFTLADGVTILTHRRIHFDITAGAATGRWKVYIPAIHTAGGDVIGIHYGNAAAPDGATQTGAQDANFKAVIEGDDSLLDVTGNGNSGTKGGTGSVEEAGPIWKAQHFNGSDDYINIGSGASLAITDEITMETWLNPDSLPMGDYKAVIYKSGDIYMLCFIYNTEMITSIGYVGSTRTYPNNLSAGVWNYIVGIYKASTGHMETYLNSLAGQIIDFTPEPIHAGDDVFLGGRGGTYTFDGLQAETRISHCIRSAAWQKFTYRNIIEADHEQTWGAEIAAVTGPSIPIIMNHLRRMREA